VHLLDQAEVIQDLYGLDLADGWRGRLEEHMIEDTDSEMLYQDAMDRVDSIATSNSTRRSGLAPMELKDWYEPFNDSCVPAFVR
jgi:hypothetical protein